MELVEPGESAKQGFLANLFGVVRVAGEAKRPAIEGMGERPNEFSESVRAAAASGG